MRNPLYFLALVLFLWGCAYYGRDFSESSAKDIQPNVTTKAQIFATFGEPVRKGIDSGYETWSYSYHTYQLDRGWRNKELYIIFNKDGTVNKYSFSSN